MKLSILMPVYNEAATLAVVFEKLGGLKLDFEVVAVDDASVDATPEMLRRFLKEKTFGFPIKVLSHPVNMGKGAAVRTAVEAAGGDVLLIQDADLEYDPAYIPELVAPILKGDKEVVYGSRLLSGKSQTYSLIYLWGNRFLTWAVNALCGSSITDSYTGYKAFRRDVIKAMDLQSRGFELEGEISVKVAMRRARFAEIPIVYRSRSREEGKKICWKDAVLGLWTIAKTWRRERKIRKASV